MFKNIKHVIDENTVFHFLSIDTYSSVLLEKITSEVAKIWNGDLDADDEIDVIKAEIKELFEGKTDLQKHGIVSEFFCHLYLREQNYEQHFLFRNLEEKGMKKGFDGIYLSEGLYWIYESKSSLESTLDTSHNANISEAYNDLKKKIEGDNTTNNPWKNAYTHAQSGAISLNKSLVATLKSFSTDYVKKKYHKINLFNVIPSSTIYLGDRWTEINCDDLKTKLSSLTRRYECKKINVICVNKRSILDFIKFVDG